MIARMLPYPVLAVGLILMWLLLAGFTRGQFVLAVAAGVGASHMLSALGEVSPKLRRASSLIKLLGVVLYDIVLSNVAVTRILLSGGRRERVSGFVTVPLRLRSPNGLAILAIVLTSTPGTAWIDYNSTRGEVLLHVFDLVDGQEWKDIIANRYEKLLLEVFE